MIKKIGSKDNSKKTKKKKIFPDLNKNTIIIKRTIIINSNKFEDLEYKFIDKKLRNTTQTANKIIITDWLSTMKIPQWLENIVSEVQKTTLKGKTKQIDK